MASTMVSLLFLLLILPIFLSFLRSKKHKPRERVRLPPGPPGLPLIGNLHQLGNSVSHRDLWLLSKEYGPLMSLRLGSVRAIVVSSAKLAEEVMKTHDLMFCSRPSLLGQRKLSYNGLDLVFGPYNEYWREMRKTCAVYLFNSNRVKTSRPIREYEVSQMIAKVSKSATVAAAPKPFNLSDAMMSLTITIICRVAYGRSYEEEGIERSRFHSLLNEAQAMFATFFFSDHLPFLGFLDRLTGLMSRLEKTFQELDVFYQEIIDEHLDPKRPKPEHEDIVDVLLYNWKDRSFKVDLTFHHIKAVLMNLLVGATDTSSATVVWAMTFLMKNTNAMKKAQEEVRRVVGTKGFVDEDDLQHLSYLKAVVKETMRLQPAAPLLVPRLSIEDSHLGGYEIPAKTLVFVNAWAIGRDPESWKSPEEFCPERFDGSSIDLKGQHFELIPFGAGRRICPGMFMGLSTVELSLANLLFRFDWEMPAGMNKDDLYMDAMLGIAMHKKEPLCFVPREHVTEAKVINEGHV